MSGPPLAYLHYDIYDGEQRPYQQSPGRHSTNNYHRTNDMYREPDQRQDTVGKGVVQNLYIPAEPVQYPPHGGAVEEGHCSMEYPVE